MPIARSEATWQSLALAPVTFPIRLVVIPAKAGIQYFDGHAHPSFVSFPTLAALVSFSAYPLRHSPLQKRGA